MLQAFCDDVERTGAIDYEAMRDYPSMLFGLETALLNLRNGTTAVRHGLQPRRGGHSHQRTGVDGRLRRDAQALGSKTGAGFHCVKAKDRCHRFRRRAGPDPPHPRPFHVRRGGDCASMPTAASRPDEAFDRLVSLSQLDHAQHRATHPRRTVERHGRSVPRVAAAHCPRRGAHRRERPPSRKPSCWTSSSPPTSF